MKNALLVAILGVCLLSGEARAGWYHVENYLGTVGPYPVHLSIQSYASFGSGLDIEGSYLYDTKETPIPLYGKRDKDRLELCEITDRKSFEDIIEVGSKTPVDTHGCPFSLHADGDALTGTWSKGSAQYPVTLKRIALLDDTGDKGKIEGAVNIPFWGQTASHMFMGIYIEADDKVCLEKIRVIAKKTRNVIQEMKFDTADCTAGLLMTPIYMNVEESKRSGKEIVTISFADGRTGHGEDYSFSPKDRKYIPTGN